MAKQGGRKKPVGGPAPCRGIDYSNLVRGEELTDKKIEQYMLDGYYGKEAQECAERRQKEAKKLSKKTKPKCEKSLTRILKFIGLANDPSDDMKQ